MNEKKSKGFILRAIQTKESDLVVKILTQNGEKITAYARSALKSKKRFSGGLQQLTHIEFRISENYVGEMPILEETRLLKEFPNLSQSIEALTLSSYLSELCDYSAQSGLENTPLYNLFGAALKAFNEGVMPYSVVAQFEIKLLSLMGWLPQMQNLKQAEKNILVLLLSQTISDTHLTFEQIHAVTGLIRSWVKQHLGDKHFKSLDVFSSLRSFQKQDMMPHPEDGTN